MKNKIKKYHLFEVAGIELEYMLVQKDSLKIAPEVDELLQQKNGEPSSDVDNGEIAWSNELVAHVVELKTNGPTKDWKNLSGKFQQNINEINRLLRAKNLMLLPTASHPFMNPLTETKLWEHSYSKVYALYNRIFNCKGHGWSNVQSMHINLPFYNDEEFEKLHAAIRVLLPLLPALAASSPIFEGEITGFKDSRMQVYKTNQKEIPVLAGKVVPEQVFNKNDYSEKIFNPIVAAILPYDTEGILEHYFLNSRGAIARFDRNAIEIRVLDLQECPKADIAIASFIIEILQWMIAELPLSELKDLHEDDLYEVLNLTIKDAEQAVIVFEPLLKLFSISEISSSANEIWRLLFQKVKNNLTEETLETIRLILDKGCLSSRILKALGDEINELSIQQVYKELASCLQENKMFQP